ncbi:hypothetical protein F5Y14DRAFT_429166 [Nemania sp. NC0429]|nr:hypothetical protein F5Y14DRAFT_429166 [Nemania sp. NC0429]
MKKGVISEERREELRKLRPLRKARRKAIRLANRLQRRKDDETREQAKPNPQSGLPIDEASQATPPQHHMTLRSSSNTITAMKTTQASTPTLTVLSTVEPVVRASSPLPPGYMFLPKGNPYMTRNAREQTRRARQVAYAVVNDDKKQIGIRVPSSICEAVSQSEKTTRLIRRQAVIEHDLSVEKRFREAILSRFPRIPPEEIHAIAHHATMKRTGRVGRTGTIEIEEKALLATQAHIRHNKTDYDALLRQGTNRESARKSTAQTVAHILKEWGPAPARSQKPITTGRTMRCTKALRTRIDSLLKAVPPQAPDKITQHTANHTDRALPMLEKLQLTEKTTVPSPETPGEGTVASLPANAPAKILGPSRSMSKKQRRRERRLAAFAVRRAEAAQLRLNAPRALRSAK